MVELDILKAYSLTEKTQEDIETIMIMTQNLPFVISYNSIEIHRLLCQNMHFRDYFKQETIYDSSKQTNIDFLIYSGIVELFIAEEDKDKDKDNEEKIMRKNLIREMKKNDCFGSFEMHIMQQNNTKITKIIAIAKEPSKCIIFENRKVLGNNNKEIVPRTRREVLATLREENKKDINNPKYYDPEIFLFDDPQKFSLVIENVKEKFNEKIDNNPAEDYCYQVMSKLKREKEFGDVLDRYNQSTGKDLKDIFNYIDSKYSSFYNEKSILDLKLGIISKKTIDTIPKAKDIINKQLDDLKDKFYDKSNSKNRNLIQLNIDKELESDDFQDYIYDEISKTKNLDELLKKKKKNDKKIEDNKRQIKKEENLLLNTYYCIFCHVNPRDAISVNCNHLVICEECMQKAKICPRCGKNIDNYHKIYRS